MIAEPTRTPPGFEKARDGVLYVSELKKLPSGEHLAVLVEKQFIGDDGYGGRTSELVMEYIAFENEQALERWVVAATASRTTFRIIRTKPVSYTVRAVFSLES